MEGDQRRIEEILSHFKMSKNAFGVSIGDKNGMRLQHISTGRNKISEKLAKDICKTYPEINYEWILYGKGEMFTNVSKTTQTNVIPVNFSEMNIMMVPLVNKFAYAGYLNGFGDHEYIDELPKIPFADEKEHKGDYLCFEVKGDSMDNDTSESYLEGDIILCRNVRQDFWRSKLHISKWDFVIVHKTDGILLKRITSHNVDTGELVLHSLNDFYEDRIINIKDVVQILNVVDVKRKIKRR